MKEGKKGQVTIFIILAIIIVSGILTFFFYVQPTFFSKATARVGFDGCIQDAMEESISDLGKNAGFISSEFTYLYNGEEITYLCYTYEYYETCTVQVPFIEKNFDSQLEKAMKNKVDECYRGSIEELIAQGYEVSSGAVNYDISLEPGVVKMALNAPTFVGSQSFTEFDIELNSPIYEMTMIATSLLQYETTFGDTNLNLISRYYPEYIITKMKRGDGTTIYTIESTIFGNKFQFASRSLVFPAGYDI